MKTRSLLLPLLFLTQALSSQKTWIVDANQGPGSHFKDLPKAVQKAKDGDILLVRKGVYHSFLLDNKGLRILGYKGVTVETGGKSPTIQIQNLGPKSMVLLKGLRVKGSTAFVRQITLDISACQGLVLIEECHIFESPFFPDPTISVSGSSQVVLNHCLVRQQISTSACHLQVTASLIYGRPRAEGFGVTGIKVTGGILELNQSIIVPGEAVGHTATPYGIESLSATILIRGNTSSLILGGLDMFNTRLPAFLELPRNTKGTSTLLIDPEVRYSGSLNPFGQRARVQALPTVTARSTSLGGSIMGELHPPAGTAYVLWSALPGPRTPTPFGDFWLNPPSMHPQIAGFARTRSDKSFRLPIPNLPQLLAIPIAFQALSWNAKGFQFSNAPLATIGK